MKRLSLAALAVAVTLSPLAAQAKEFCAAPLTPQGGDYVRSTTHFKAFPQEISKAIVEFCRHGQEAAELNISASEVTAQAEIIARRWVNSSYGGDGMQDNERWALEGGLYNSMIAGYTQTRQPAQPQPTNGQIATAEKAAADKAAAAKKAAANKKAAVSGVDDLLGDLHSGKNPPKMEPKQPQQQPNKAQFNSDISDYIAKVQTAIKYKLLLPEGFEGKKCALHIELARDGKLTSIKGATGDLALCGAAIKAANAATFPAAPNDAVYQVFKSPVLDLQF